MQIKNKNIFRFLIKELFSLPIWIKQIIYLELKEEFETPSMKSYFDSITKEHCFQLHIPKLTYAGRKEIENRTEKYKKNIYGILEGAFEGLSVIEIAIANNWNLAECSKYFLEAIDNEAIVNPALSVIKGTALYMGGRIRLGEYFVKIEKINMEELDEALRTQKHMEESMGDRPGLAEILVDLGYLVKDDTEGILLLKKDCNEYYKSNITDQKDLFISN